MAIAEIIVEEYNQTKLLTMGKRFKNTNMTSD